MAIHDIHEKSTGIPRNAHDNNYLSQEPFASYSGSDTQVIIRKAISPALQKQIIDEYTSKIKALSQRSVWSVSEEEFQRREEEIENIRKAISTIKESALAMFKVGNIETLSISTHREKVSARSFGSTYARGYTRGPRTVAGTMTFTVFDQGALTYLIDQDNILVNAERHADNQATTFDFKMMLPDQIMPFDILILYQNEYGNTSSQALFDVEIVNESQTQSIHDLVLGNAMNYVCRGISPMRLDYRTFLKIADMHSGRFENQQLFDAANNVVNRSAVGIEILINDHEVAAPPTDDDLFLTKEEQNRRLK